MTEKKTLQLIASSQFQHVFQVQDDLTIVFEMIREITFYVNHETALLIIIIHVEESIIISQPFLCNLICIKDSIYDLKMLSELFDIIFMGRGSSELVFYPIIGIRLLIQILNMEYDEYIYTCTSMSIHVHVHLLRRFAKLMTRILSIILDRILYLSCKSTIHLTVCVYTHTCDSMTVGNVCVCCTHRFDTPFSKNYYLCFGFGNTFLLIDIFF